MAKFQSPLLGYNNNVRHRGRVFHIQTEDSGVNHPHIITHLFMDGGRILKSVKKSYAEHVGADGMSETVRLLMKEQHKAMFIALRDGQFDALVDLGKPGDSGQKKAVKPPPVAAPVEAAPPPPPSADIGFSESEPNTIAGMRTITPADRPAVPTPPSDPVVTVVDVPIPEDAAAAVEIFMEESSESVVSAVYAALDAERSTDALAPLPEPDVTAKKRPSVKELVLDFDALERDTSSERGSYFPPADLPPPPKNLFTKERGRGTYSSTTDATEAAHHDHVPTPSRPPPAPRASRPPEGRYGPSPTGGDLRRGDEAALAFDLQRRAPERQVARRSDPELPRGRPRAAGPEVVRSSPRARRASTPRSCGQSCRRDRRSARARSRP